MPTISQLPTAAAVSPGDQIPISQGGAACSASVGLLLASAQPAILAPSGTLLGRTSLGPGGPDPVAIGEGLLLSSGSLVATGADHATFPIQGTLCLTDKAVLSGDGLPKLLQLSLLRGIYTPGSNIAIDQNGTISVTAGTSYAITNLPTVGTVAAADLIAISQAGADHTISYANFLGGKTIDETQAATTASDTDTLLVGQGGSSLVCQNFGAVWAWIAAKLSGVQAPTLELTANAALTASVHNGHVLICSQPIVVSLPSAIAGSSFTCHLLNVSTGNVTFSGNVVSSSGSGSLGPGQAATAICTSYSGGALAYVWMSSSGSAQVSTQAPGQVTGLTANDATASTVPLTWSVPVSAGEPSSYTVQYRVSGTTLWINAGTAVTTNAFTVTGLNPSTSYDFEVTAVNADGSGPASAPTTASTTAGTSVTSIVWNITPSGNYSHGSGTIALNAHVSPSNVAVQFGFSTSSTMPPTAWTAASYVNSDLWGAYVPTPGIAGIWYAWAEGTDGSSPTLFPTGFSVT